MEAWAASLFPCCRIRGGRLRDAATQTHLRQSAARLGFSISVTISKAWRVSTDAPPPIANETNPEPASFPDGFVPAPGQHFRLGRRYLHFAATQRIQGRHPGL